jgi:hypothetical protein
MQTVARRIHLAARDRDAFLGGCDQLFAQFAHFDFSIPMSGSPLKFGKAYQV